MKKKLCNEKIHYFKRWSRKRFAAFNSLKKLVVISAIPIGCSFLGKPTDGFAQNTGDTASILLEKITVTEEAPPETDGVLGSVLLFSLPQTEIGRVATTSVNELLKRLPGIDIRQRGPFGTQADISYRGGNFDQTMVLLNGVNFTDPQTGHYSLNLPVSPDIIHKIELFRNTTAFLFGTSPFSGMLNMVTKPENKNRLSMHLSGGMYGYFNETATLNLKTGKVSHLLSFNHSQSDGYKHNTDFGITNLFYHLSGNFDKGSLEFQTGYVDKHYGANGFYSTRFPDQYESTGTFLTSISWHSKGRFEWKPTLYYRNNTDCFELVKNQPKEKNNYHATQVAGFHFLSSLQSRIGKTSLSLDFRGEDVASTSLGDKLQQPVHSAHFDTDFTHGRTRMNTGLALSHLYKRKRWEVGATALMNYFFDLKKKCYFLPAIHTNYQFAEKEHRESSYRPQIYFSMSSTARMPTFTDLYYKTGDILGNSDLLPEQAITAEIGSQLNAAKRGQSLPWLSASLNLFARHGIDMIDYVKKDEETMWHVVNHSAVTFLGLDAYAVWYPRQLWNDRFFITQISLQYSYLYSNKESRGYQSRYVLDHLNHNLTLSLSHIIWKSLTIDYAFSYRDRKGEYTSYETDPTGEKRSFPAYGLVNIKINYEHSVAKFYIEISNVLNQKCFDIGDIEQPGIWIIGGIKCKMGL